MQRQQLVNVASIIIGITSVGDNTGIILDFFMGKALGKEIWK